MNIIESIRETLEAHTLIPDGKLCLVGVSGGADSVALLRALHLLGIPVTVAHLNHQLRGEASDADEQFVRELADELNLPIVTRSVDVHQLAASTNLSLEMAARRARHDFFESFTDSVIALGHHADDQVETFILKLARGAGSAGLSGMAYRQTLGPLTLIRPLLDIPRADIMQWMEKNDFTWREDASNQDPSFLRNRVRHQILPVLKDQLNPNIQETILRTIDILREENAWMETILGGATLKDLPELSIAARRRVLRNGLFEQGVTDLDFAAVDKILALMESSQGTVYFDLNQTRRVVIEYGKLRLETQRAAPIDPHWTLHIKKGTGWKKDHGMGAGVLPAEASFSAEKVGDSPIQVRGFEPGDRIKPVGMEGSRKLQDIFTDQKIPRAQRLNIPVVLCRDEIIWIPGFRTARDWQVEGAAEKSFHIRIEHNRTN